MFWKNVNCYYISSFLWEVWKLRSKMIKSVLLDQVNSRQKLWAGQVLYKITSSVNRTIFWALPSTLWYSVFNSQAWQATPIKEQWNKLLSHTTKRNCDTGSRHSKQTVNEDSHFLAFSTAGHILLNCVSQKRHSWTFGWPDSSFRCFIKVRTKGLNKKMLRYWSSGFSIVLLGWVPGHCLTEQQHDSLTSVTGFFLKDSFLSEPKAVDYLEKEVALDLIIWNLLCLLIISSNNAKLTCGQGKFNLTENWYLNVSSHPHNSLQVFSCYVLCLLDQLEPLITVFM